MTLRSSGPISMTEIKTELNASTYSLHALHTLAGLTIPDAMSEFWGYSSVNYILSYGIAPQAWDGARNSIKLANGGVGIVNQTWLRRPGVEVSSKGVILLDADLNYDFTFNNNDTGTGNAGTVYCLAEMPDGKIVVGGNVITYNGTASRAIYRLNRDGTLDTTFLGTNVFANQDTVTDMVALPDGKLIIIGDFTNYSGNPAPGICRLNADGSFDNTFTGVGTGFTSGTPYSIGRLSTGDLILSGDFTQYNGQTVGRILKLDSNGTLDNTFQTNIGTGVGTFGYERLAVSIAYDDKIYLKGWYQSFNGTSRNTPIRLNTNGTIDTGFANYTPATTEPDAMTPLPNGQVIYSGHDGTWANYQTLLFNEDGTLATTLSSTHSAQDVVAISDTVFVLLGLSNWNGTAVPNIAVINSSGTILNTYQNHA